RVLAAGLGQLDAPAEADLAALRVLADHTAGGDREHLQSPAAAEHRRAGLQCGAYEFDLVGDGRTGLVNVQARARDGDAIVAFECLSVRQVHSRIRGKADVDHSTG